MPAQPSLDAVFELLADRRRRYALYHLAEVGEDRALDVEDVAARVAEWEREWDATGNPADATGGGPESTDSTGGKSDAADPTGGPADATGAEPGATDSTSTDRRERVRLDLHHNHLPRLADAGLIDYDARTGTVRSREAPSLDRLVPEDSAEFPRLRSLLAVDDVIGEESDTANGGSSDDSGAR